MTGAGPGTQLRGLINAPGMVVVPCVHDALMARMAEQAGFPTVDIESAGSLAMAFGLSDHGIGNVSDLLGHARDVAMTLSVPAFADIDNGGGTPLTVARAVSVAQRVGLAGVHLDDVTGGRKAFPGYADQLVDEELALNRIRAAVDARADGDLVIVARTYVPEIEHAIDRLQQFKELGADVFFPVRHGYDAIIASAGLLPAPLYAVDARNVAPPSDLEGAGVKFVMDNDVFQIAIKVVRDLLTELRQEEFIAGAAERSLSWREFHEVMGSAEVTRQAERYGML